MIAPSTVLTAGIIDAPRDAVLAARTTKERQELWTVDHGEIDLRIRGTMLTHYDAKGQIGDPSTIENSILSFEPKRMLALRVVSPPANFRFTDAIKKMCTAIHFDDAGPARARLRIVGVGYGDEEHSKKLRAFFDKGNSYTHKKLQEDFAAKEGRSRGGH
jgi:uncharacterized protein YndB with AHSA1/START domain